jgi:putative two-component system response regulator
MKGKAMDNISNAPPNILIIDDINANLTVLTEIIRKEGYIARPVTSVKQAWSAIDALAPNLILLDISMPEISGFEFCSMLKKNSTTRDIPVIFITALNSIHDKIKAFQLGAVDYITKPFEVEEVTIRIYMHLKMYKTQQELEVYNKKLYKIINEQLRKIYEGQKQVVEAITKIATINNPLRAAHLKRVGDNARILAISLQLSAKFKEQVTNSFIDAIDLAAQLHNIGFMGIEDALLAKEVPTEEKMDLIKKHPQIGADVLEEVFALGGDNEFVKMAINIARYHHENWDGSGYPAKLTGNEIPLCARIVSVVETYDSLACLNNCGHTVSHEEAMRMMNKDAGSVFDPDIIDVFNKIQNQLKRIDP